jgi:hypothetical protein
VSRPIRFRNVGYSGFTLKTHHRQTGGGKAARKIFIINRKERKGRKVEGTTRKDTKFTKLRNGNVISSEFFVAFVIFVVRRIVLSIRKLGSKHQSISAVSDMET